MRLIDVRVTAASRYENNHRDFFDVIGKAAKRLLFFANAGRLIVTQISLPSSASGPRDKM